MTESNTLSPKRSCSWRSASRECTSRMSAMLRTTPEPVEVRVERLLRELHDLQRLLHALEREVLRLGRDQRMVGGHQRVHGEQPERRRAVDQDQVVAALQRPATRGAASARGPSCRPGPARPRPGPGWREHRPRGSRRPPWPGRRARPRPSGRRRRDVEVVGQVALRVEVHAQDVEPGAPEDVGERADGRRLAGAALLGEDRDGRTHCSGEDTRPREPVWPRPVRDPLPLYNFAFPNDQRAPSEKARDPRGGEEPCRQ